MRNPFNNSSPRNPVARLLFRYIINTAISFEAVKNRHSSIARPFHNRGVQPRPQPPQPRAPTATVLPQMRFGLH